MKKYQVIIQDEYNNLHHYGFYNKLSDAIPNINDFLFLYNVEITELNEYPSTYTTCFDKEVEVDGGVVMIRGFIFDDEYLKGEIM